MKKAIFVGKLNCAEIRSVAKSDLGETSLTSYFNEEHGFVRLEYVNIDGSKMLINCVRVE